MDRNFSQKPEYQSLSADTFTRVKGWFCLLILERIKHATPSLILPFRYPVIQQGDFQTLRVVRYGGSSHPVSVKYSTVIHMNTVTHGGVLMTPATQQQDFAKQQNTITFNPGQVSNKTPSISTRDR